MRDFTYYLGATDYKFIRKQQGDWAFRHSLLYYPILLSALDFPPKNVAAFRLSWDQE